MKHQQTQKIKEPQRWEKPQLIRISDIIRGGSTPSFPETIITVGGMTATGTGTQS